jgi:hypothetical protein
MKVGTKSVLFGAHCFIIHPFFVMVAWIKLYGWPWHPAIWLSFFFHDLGYLGKPNMDGEEGERHVELGAKILSIFDYRFMFKNTHKVYRDYPYYTDLGYKVVFEFLGYTLAKRNTKKWANFSRYHSRFYAKRDKVSYSRLCVADKLAIVLEPYWLYLPRVRWSGEIKEYMAKANVGKYDSQGLSVESQRLWFDSVCSYLGKWVKEHKDLKADKWT